MSDEVAAKIKVAERLFQSRIPTNTKIIIEPIDCQIYHGFNVRLEYTSSKSGKRMCTKAKATDLPMSEGHLLDFYLYQLVLTPKEIAQRFSRIAFLEKRAKQEAWLAMGKQSRNEDGDGDLIKIFDELTKEDMLEAKQYSPAAQMDAIA